MRYNIFNRNLLGDGLMATPAMRAFANKLGPDDEFYLFTQREPHTYIYGYIPYFKETFAIDFDNPPPELEVPTEKGKWLDTKNGKSIYINIGMSFNNAVRMGESHAQGYAKQLDVYPLTDLSYDAGICSNHMNVAMQFYNEQFVAAAGLRPIIIISHISRSCASRAGQPANKMLSPEVWREVVENLQDKYFFVFITDKEEDNESIKGFGDCGYMDSVPIFIVGAFLKLCHMLITVENGMLVLAQAVGANILGIAGAGPLYFYWTGTKGESLIIDYTGRGPHVVSADKIITSILSLSEAIEGRI